MIARAKPNRQKRRGDTSPPLFQSQLLTGVRGTGLWLAIALAAPAAAAVETAARQAGFLVNAVQPDAVRLAPPLILSAAQAQSFTDALPGILDAAARAGAGQ